MSDEPNTNGGGKVVTVTVKKTQLIEAIRKCSTIPTGQKRKLISHYKDQDDSATEVLDLGKADREILMQLLQLKDVPAKERAKLRVTLTGITNVIEQEATDDFWGTEVTSAQKVCELIKSLPTNKPNLEIFIGKRWYPVTITAALRRSKHYGTWTELQVNYRICHENLKIYWVVSKHTFEEKPDKTLRLIDLVSEFNLRPLQLDMVEYNAKLGRTERLVSQDGKQLSITGQGLQVVQSGYMPYVIATVLGEPESPRRVVLESELEVVQAHTTRWRADENEISNQLPFVRMFSLDRKEYFYADVDDIEAVEYQENVLDRLIIPHRYKEVLQSVFDYDQSNTPGDVLKTKHGGMIILAMGNPGVGKTLTAEAYAEHKKKPLYVLGMSEVGTSIKMMEQAMRTVFTRVIKWGAVLLFDEVDVFLAERDSAQLERTAIVGAFLRLLDYYQGVLFLTTNRPQVLDHAILSRVMLRIPYPDLTPPVRKEIWVQLFRLAKVKYTGGYEAIAHQNLDGRQIRNITRLIKVMYGEQELTEEQVREAVKLSLGGDPKIEHGGNSSDVTSKLGESPNEFEG
jgi:hypothetical protein